MERSLFTEQAKRWGTVLGAALTLLCALASAIAAHSLLHPQFVQADDVVLFALKAIAALVLARLSLICAFATSDVMQAETNSGLPLPTSGQLFARSKSRHRLAGWLLAAAAAFGPATASAATATPVTTISMSASADKGTGNDPFLTLEASQVSTASSVPSHSDESCPSIPEPGWTLPAGTSSLGCRVLGGGAPPPRQRTHVVQRGETVWGIAASYLPRSASNSQIASSVHAWVQANPLTLAHPDLIQVGDTLTIPTA